MNHPQIQIAILAFCLLLAPVGCASDEESGKGDGGQTLQEVASFVSDPDPVISLLGGYAEGLLNDLEPADNDVVFNLQTGEVE